MDRLEAELTAARYADYFRPLLNKFFEGKPEGRIAAIGATIDEYAMTVLPTLLRDRKSVNDEQGDDGEQ